MSASFDHTVKLWSLSGDDEGSEAEEPSAKKARTGKKEAAKRAVQQVYIVFGSFFHPPELASATGHWRGVLICCTGGLPQGTPVSRS